MFVIYKQPSGFMASNGIPIMNQTPHFFHLLKPSTCWAVIGMLGLLVDIDEFITNTVWYGRLQGFQ